MHPYEKLPPRAFWKPAVADRDILDLWDPKFNIEPGQKIVTFGSCFAQHIGKALIARGFDWLSTERPPLGLGNHTALYNYNIFSARTGSIYTTSLLKQWTEWALEISEAPKEIWGNNDRFYDPFRPRIEPDGFESKEEMKKSQAQAIFSFKRSLKSANYFMFTLGLTESWFNKQGGYEYPICPGIAAGKFDSSKHKFRNQQFSEVLKKLIAAIEMMRSANKKLKFILTVSPVPLAATISGSHVAIATMESKSILRAVAGQLSRNRPYVDYFPSYEIINSPLFKGAFFDPNLRTVNSCGVNLVMDNFFECLAKKYGEQKATSKRDTKVEMDTVCEEELLEAFGE